MDIDSYIDGYKYIDVVIQMQIQLYRYSYRCIDVDIVKQIYRCRVIQIVLQMDIDIQIVIQIYRCRYSYIDVDSYIDRYSNIDRYTQGIITETFCQGEQELQTIPFYHIVSALA